jgi:hypothetical protein
MRSFFMQSALPSHRPAWKRTWEIDEAATYRESYNFLFTTKI